MEKSDLEKIKNKLSLVYGLKSSYAYENTSVSVVYIYKDPQRRDAESAIDQATKYIKGRYPKVNVLVYDKL